MARKCEDVYMEPIVLQLENAIVRCYRPILTPDERERRTKRVAIAAANMLCEQRGEPKQNWEVVGKIKYLD